jgi:hypothetical protein
MWNDISLGTFTKTFLTSAQKFTLPEVFGIAFIIVAVSLYWARFINDLPTTIGED